MDATLLEHPRSPNFMETPFAYDSLSTLDYLQYPQESPYGVPMALPGPSSSSPRLDFNSLNLTQPMPGEYSYSSGSYTTASPGRPFTPPDNGIAPPSLYNLSGAELSSDALSSGRRSRGSGTQSPASVNSIPYDATVPRSHRFNPIAVPATRPSVKATRRKSRNDSDDEDEDFQPLPPTSNNADQRRETIRRQRIESEQRRRDELRDGYRRLKDALPVSNQKSSKVSLLDRATTHVKYLEMTAQQLQVRLQQAENEVQRLRSVNEALMLGTAEQRHAAAAAAVAAASQQSQPSF
ncbi:hypothetical protein CONPUDRAFT_134418 [Coniophora puteana RWD-64-598 SS2]|uniref:BHLH domain-containing protein n=1 Tax=Coniophora puteana (strain RWD-64-598) TaxID=741705 RepID=A0A5M3N7H7_CONPW|nr:uncharacterized protein CONPUDRAFT_134418 [Coniophora puteana RWD-64-598 SS2]EIW87117.1 hypothetical protein CONPUDRAFT_134418 [Coniophora puteana RWD-64-598 SS2]